MGLPRPPRRVPRLEIKRPARAWDPSWAGFDAAGGDRWRSTQRGPSEPLAARFDLQLERLPRTPNALAVSWIEVSGRWVSRRLRRARNSARASSLSEAT